MIAGALLEIRTILMVDDEPDIRQIGLLSLRGVGKWSATAASTGAEALALAATLLPDVILLDVMMPGMDGLTTLARLREVTATAVIPVIFMTAKAQQSEVERYRVLGAAGVIRKPFDPMTLPREIRDLLGAT